MSRPLSFGQDANLLRLKIADPVIKPHAEMINGCVYSAMIIEMPRYSLDDVLCQLLDDYGEEKIIERIKQL
jgi:hypothetical protein